MKLSVASLSSWTPLPPKGRVTLATYAARVVDLDDDDAPTIVALPVRSSSRGTRTIDAQSV